MHLTAPEARHWCVRLRELIEEHGAPDRAELAVFPPFTSIAEARRSLDGLPVAVGGQNLHWEVDGAFTGEVSGRMLHDAGCRYVLVGHSERRHVFGESDERIARKVAAAREAGLVPVLCVGETLEERDRDATLPVVEAQLRRGLGEPGPRWTSGEVLVAYEPVWAIGTGRTATTAQAQEVHHALRTLLDDILEDGAGAARVLYGGSVKPSNAADLMAQRDVDGALVGGASLEPRDFLAIARAA
jgi:triosephosphate isomerase